jgi:hypothetical protein
MNRPTLARPTRKLLAGLLVVSMASLAVGWTVGNVAASGGTHSTPSSTSGDKANSGSSELVAPGVPQVGLNTGTETRVAASGLTTGTSVAYPAPIYPGSLGAAPERTILAAGNGTADMKPDGSDRASALPKATAAALADAKAQAQAVATSMSVALKSIYSVTISTADNLAYPMPDCLVVPPATPSAVQSGSASTGSASAPNAAASVAPAIAPVPSVCSDTKTTTPTSAQLVVTVIVAYSFA